MKLKELLSGIEYTTKDDLTNIDVERIVCDSKEAAPGDLFVAIRGTNLDGHNFIDEAIKEGAAVVASETPVEKKDIVNIVVKDTRGIFSQLCAKIFNYPSKKIKLVGITGTNGKTTTAYLINDILKFAGFKSGLIGTVEYSFADKIIPATHTTPDAWRLNHLLDQMLKNSSQYCVMEVSSHALDQKRVGALNFSAAIFTNITHDHLDYHKDFEGYSLAKLKLFEQLASDSAAIINADVPFSETIKNKTKAKILDYAIAEKAMVKALEFDWDIEGMTAKIKTPKGALNIKSPLKGAFNLYNILAAISYCIYEDIAPEIIKEAIAKFSGAPGRLEKIGDAERFNLFIDYAHTPDALKNVLTTLRKFTKGRLIVVFGCGGNRDRLKRPKMGRVAAELSDFCIITSDNPRWEEPRVIAQEVVMGIEQDKNNYEVILDRQDAIRRAISMACVDDTILLAGKGHEQYQIIKDQKLNSDDREIVRKLIDADH